MSTKSEKQAAFEAFESLHESGNTLAALEEACKQYPACAPRLHEYVEEYFGLSSVSEAPFQHDEHGVRVQSGAPEAASLSSPQASSVPGRGPTCFFERAVDRWHSILKLPAAALHRFDDKGNNPGSRPTHLACAMLRILIAVAAYGCTLPIFLAVGVLLLPYLCVTNGLYGCAPRLSGSCSHRKLCHVCNEVLDRARVLGCFLLVMGALALVGWLLASPVSSLTSISGRFATEALGMPIDVARSYDHELCFEMRESQFKRMTKDFAHPHRTFDIEPFVQALTSPNVLDRRAAAEWLGALGKRYVSTTKGEEDISSALLGAFENETDFETAAWLASALRAVDWDAYETAREAGLLRKCRPRVESPLAEELDSRVFLLATTRIAEGTPFEPVVGCELGFAYAHKSQFAEAAEQFKIALEQQPNLYETHRKRPSSFREPHPIADAFAKAGQLEQLATLLLDSKQFRPALDGTDIIVPLLSKEQSRDVGMEVLGRAWDGHSHDRIASDMMVTSIVHWARTNCEPILDDPCMYDYLREVLLRSEHKRYYYFDDLLEIAVRQHRSPELFEDVLRPASGGDGEGDILVELIELAKLDNTLAQAAKQVEEQTPDWIDGKALCTAVAARYGETAQVQKLVADLTGAAELPASVVILCAGAELQSSDELSALACQLYEHVVEYELSQSASTIITSSARTVTSLSEIAERLTETYRRDGQLKQNRELQRRIRDHLLTIAAHQGQVLRQKIIQTSTVKFRATDGPGYFKAIFEDSNKTVHVVADWLAKNGFASDARKLRPEEDTPEAERKILELAVNANDIMSFLGSEEALSYPLVPSLKKARSEEKSVADTLLHQLQEVATTHPHDISRRIAATLVELTSGTPESQRQTVRDLIEALRKEPPNTEGSTVCHDGRELWQVARVCLGDRPLGAFAPQGRALAAFAYERAWGKHDSALMAQIERTLKADPWPDAGVFLFDDGPGYPR